MTNKEQPKHALLGASSSGRWIACPPSVNLSKGQPNRSSSYANEGTLAHEIAELALSCKAFKISRAQYGRRVGPLRKREHYHPDMERHAVDYAEHVLALAMGADTFDLRLETRVDYSRWASGGFGTTDAAMFNSFVLHVVDYKYGAGIPVDTVRNSQLMLYGLGAMETLGYEGERVVIHVVQPRVEFPAAPWETTRSELLEFAENEVVPAAKLALGGGGAFATGDHCKFCPSLSVCSFNVRQAFASVSAPGELEKKARADTEAEEADRISGKPAPIDPNLPASCVFLYEGRAMVVVETEDERETCRECDLSSIDCTSALREKRRPECTRQGRKNDTAAYLKYTNEAPTK